MARRRRDDDYPEGETSTAAWWAAQGAAMDADIAAERAYAESADGIAERLEIHEGYIVRENMDPAAWEERHAALTAKLAAARAREEEGNIEPQARAER